MDPWRNFSRLFQPADDAPRRHAGRPLPPGPGDDRPVGPKLVRRRRLSQRPSSRPNPIATWIVALAFAAALVAFRFRFPIGRLLSGD